MKMETGGEFIGTRYHIKVIETMQHGSNKKVKRFRSAFTTDQVNYLEKQFKKSPFIGNAQRKEVAEALNIPERAVKIWFQNRRMKEKKEGTFEEIDDKQGIRKCQEYIRNNNNNVRLPSANENPRSLPLIASLNQGSCKKNNIRMETNTSTSNIKRQIVQYIENLDSAAKIAAPDTQHVVTAANSDELVINPPAVFLKTNHSSLDKTSAEFAIDLCKKYKSEYDAKSAHVEQHNFNKGSENVQKIEQHNFKKDFENVKKMEEPMSVEFTEHMTPEDLSQKIYVSAKGPQQTVSDNASSNSRSLVPTNSLLYTQPSISTGSENVQKIEQHNFKKDFENVKKMEEPMSVEFTEHMTPEDLSQKINVSAKGPQQTVPDNASSNSRSLVPTNSLLYTQPSISTGGVVWSVMPVVTSISSPFSAPSNPLLNMSPVQDNFAKRPCSCDCHVRQVMPQIPNNFPQQSPRPHYIITAVPFQNPTTNV